MSFFESLIGPVVGGLLGGSGSDEKSTTQNSIDPRMAQYIYGANGVLPMADRWYSQNSSGMTPQMTTGMNNQWAQLNRAAPGYAHMQNLGMGLMGAPIAGNPFTSSGPQGGGYQGGYQGGQQQAQGGPFAMPTTQPYQAQQNSVKQQLEALGITDGNWGGDVSQSASGGGLGLFGNGATAYGSNIQGLMNGPLGVSIGRVANLFDPRTNYAPVEDRSTYGGNDGGLSGDMGLGGGYGDLGGASLGGGLGGGGFGGIGNDGYGDMGGYW